MLGGTDELWLRIPFAIFGLGIVAVTYWMTVFITRNNLAGILASTLLLADIEFLFRSRQINTDIPLTFLLLLTLLAFLRKHWLVGWAAWGMAFLTKRATPLLLLPALLLLWWWQRKQIDKTRWLMGMMVFGVIVAGWHGYMYYRFGTVFIQQYVMGFTIGKIASINPVTGTDPVMYMWALKHAFKVFALALPVALIWAVREWKLWRVVLVVIATFMVMLTVAPIKASWYLLPIHPLLAIITGSFLAWIVSQITDHRSQIVVFLLVGMVTAWQLINWQGDYMVPDTTGNQAKMALAAGALTNSGKKIYLDDDYLPVAVFYSGRQVVPLRFNRLTMERNELSIPENHYILTNLINLPALAVFLPNYEMVADAGDLVLIKSGLR